MAKSKYELDSLEDLKLEPGLLPRFESLFIREHLKKILGRLYKVDLDEINLHFKMFGELRDSFFENAKKDPRYPEILEMMEKISASYHASLARPLTLPDELNKFHGKSMLVEFFSSPDSPFGFKDAPYIAEQLLPGVEVSDKFLGLVALFLYFIALQETKELHGNTDPYYRLGKISRYLYISQLLIELNSYLLAEFNTIKMKEDDYKKRKISAGRKGADEAHKTKNKVKRDLIKSYIKALEATDKIKKSHFVQGFVDNLPENERREFSATNIHRTLKEALTDYEKGRISPQIWSD